MEQTSLYNFGREKYKEHFREITLYFEFCAVVQGDMPFKYISFIALAAFLFSGAERLCYFGRGLDQWFRTRYLKIFWSSSGHFVQRSRTIC